MLRKVTDKIVIYPDPILREEAQPVVKITKEILDLAESMTKVMIGADGIGLAANQVGLLHRIFVINSSPHEEEASPIIMINPVILDQEGSIVEAEGCLSFPELYVTIDRADKVRVRARSIYNEDMIYETSGLMARAIQHEIDHLNGVLIIDHAMSKEDKDRIEQWQKDNQQTANL
jgi:peptide deformylase